ncbi:phosphoribosyl-ATP diphosphatase [Leuconostoc lactis]|uniref:phosphoribosyl-ATP diphosphatase n=1 Tax=Leuconostoc lactis TaxID=1246 RepID=UPI0024AD274E|nr:phosphoribosyl-ATP diphosphatase [Leuconostoc lactis]MDI6574075.1 phosphoribosyl-ATP diphosphatase [Leuconostoc lactis]
MTKQTLEELYDLAYQRHVQPIPEAYTSYLYAQGQDKILKKVGEEATEVILGAKNNREELIYETADLFFHLIVLLVSTGVSLAEIEAELGARVGQQSRLHERQNWRGEA